MKIRNPKSEIRNKFKFPKFKTNGRFRIFEPLIFGFVSSLDIRVSDFIFVL